MSSFLQEYIDSGVIYNYCIGMLSATERQAVEHMCALHPQLQQELTDTQRLLEGYAALQSKVPAAATEDRIWSTLDNINKENNGDINDLPIINKYSDYLKWKKMLSHMIPQGIPEGKDLQVLRHQDGVTQILVTSSIDVEDEVHHHERESFLVLEGECECHIGSNIVKLGPGGYIDIPMYEHHNVQIRSPRVVAVLQHLAI